MQVTPAYLSSVATFYDMLRTEPAGSRYVYVCTSVACHLRNAKSRLRGDRRRRRTRRALEGVELREFECLGACDMAPMASVDGRYVGPLSERRRRRVRPPAEGRRDGAARARAGGPRLPSARAGAAAGRAAGAPDVRATPAGGDVARTATGSTCRQADEAAEPRARADSPSRSTPGTSVMPEPDEEDERVTETRVLLANIDEPGLNTIDGLRAPRRLRVAAQGAARDDAGDGAGTSSRSRGCAAAAAPASRWARRRASSPRARWTSTCAATPTSPSRARSRTACLMQKNPHLLIEGCIIGSIAAGANKGFIFIRGEYELQADILDAAVAEAYEKGYLGDGILGSDHSFEPGRAPRPGRVHLRRGDRPARRARGQARQPAPEAAVPRQPGPLPGPHADQQRRDALQHADHHRARRRLVQAVRRGQLDRHEARLRLRQRAAPGQLRGRARRPGAGDHLRARRRPARGARAQVLLPRRLVGAGADEGAPRPAVHLRGDGRGRVDARHRRR